MSGMLPYPSHSTDVFQAHGNPADEKIIFSFFCPACKMVHQIDKSWSLTGPASRPTLAHSVKTEGVQDLTDDETNMILAGKDVDVQSKKFICHSQIKDGYISFYADSTHDLKGQVVMLPYVLDPQWVAYRERFNVPFVLAGK